ncbi:hypothetical protein QTP88_022817 [Uroleucon formosanum]
MCGLRIPLSPQYSVCLKVRPHWRTNANVNQRLRANAPFAIRRLKFGIGKFSSKSNSDDDDDDMILAAANFIIIKHLSKKNKKRKVRRWWMNSLNKNRANFGGNHLLDDLLKEDSVCEAITIVLKDCVQNLKLQLLEIVKMTEMENANG